jgi:GAF domain-containing protein
VLDEQRLCRAIVDVIRAQLALRYVGLFLLDPGGSQAELRAESGDAREDVLSGEQRALPAERLIRRAVDAVGSGEATWSDVIVGEGRSDGAGALEAVLPLRSRGRVLGALLVRSDRPDAFEEGLLVALQTMADQVAGSIDNARLYEDSQALLAAARRATGELSLESWAEVLNARADLGFRSSETGIERVVRGWRPEAERAMREASPVVGATAESEAGEARLSVPVRLYGQSIGAVELAKPAGAGRWTPDQIVLVEQIVDELSQALENARLYQETQRRSLRERQLRQIGTRMQSTVDLDAILRGAVEDLARALDVSSAFVQLYEGRPVSGEPLDLSVRDVDSAEERHGGETADLG